MDDERWKPIVETPSKPPIPSNILVPDPSPARSTTSDGDSQTLLPPSPQGSFIHRRRQGQYVPRPPVWNIEDFGQAFNDSDSSYNNYPTSELPSNSNHSHTRLSGLTTDDQVRQMANVFNNQPLVVNMMTGQDPEDGAEIKSAQRETFEADLTAALGSGSELTAGERSYVDSGNPSAGTTALASKRSSNLVERNKNTTESLELSTLTPRNAATKPAVPVDPSAAADDFADPKPSNKEARVIEKGKRQEAVSATAQGLQSHHTATDILPASEQVQQETTDPQEQAGRRLSRSRNEEDELANPIRYDASHIAMASRVPNSLQNSSATDDAGLTNLPEGSVSQQDTTPPQRSAAKKRSLKNLIPGTIRRSTRRDIGPSEAQTPPPLPPRPEPYRDLNRNDDYDARGEIAKEALSREIHTSRTAGTEAVKEKRNPVKKFKTWGKKLTSGIRDNIKETWSGGPFKSKKLRTRNMKSNDQEGSGEVQHVSDPTLQTRMSSERVPLRTSSDTQATLSTSEDESRSPEYPTLQTCMSDERDPLRTSSDTQATSSTSDDESRSPASEQPYETTHMDRKRHAHPGTRIMKEDPRDMGAHMEVGPSYLEPFPAYVDMFDLEQDPNRRSWSSGHPSQASRFRPKADDDQISSPVSPVSSDGQASVAHRGQNEENNRRSWSSGHPSQASRFRPKDNDDPSPTTTRSAIPVAGPSHSGPSQAPLGDITNRGRRMRHRPAIVFSRSPAPGASRRNEGSPTSQERYAARIAAAQEELVPAPPPATVPMIFRPNDLRAEIRAMNPDSPISRQSSG